MGTALLFFLGLGVKDLRDKLKKVDQMCMEMEKIRGNCGKAMAEITGQIRMLEQRIEDAERS